MRTFFMIWLVITLLGTCLADRVLAQRQAPAWLARLEDSGDHDVTLVKTNLAARYSRYDFSQAIKPQSEFLGFIEPNYQRLKVYFDKIAKSKSDPTIYLVKGATVVKDNLCDFTGTITLTQVREYRATRKGADVEYSSQDITKHGVAIGRFRFAEDPKQTHVGVFEGTMFLYWYLDNKGKIRYDDVEVGADGYRNNQYVSTWTPYGSKNGKTANWGEYRIPLSGDLDIGDGEFSVNPKYLENGWRGYKTP